MLPEKPLLSELSHSWQLRPIKSTLIMIVRWDFEAAGEVEMDCKAGEILIPMAIPENDDWIYAKGVSRTGFGMVPLAWLSVISRTGQKYDTKEEALRELREIGILKLSDLLALQRKYREGCLRLGRLPDSPRGKSGQ
ncbi:hypothetical protein EDB81DRAFT_814156 [Dactylonectria macrodidyma]|uniref:SH3 domain-containing protein n=1 Tax=Dactylonectria macrodidyma TaxID=307937 RepID=A0A9P9DJ55_9HYPO|nr:hypothetical protein EDB81DRAFT_814156 [Dactylonectria macrodidyma]